MTTPVPVFYIEDGTLYLNGKMEINYLVGNPSIQFIKNYGESFTLAADNSCDRIMIVYAGWTYIPGGDGDGYEPVVYINGQATSMGTYGCTYPFTLAKGVEYTIHTDMTNADGWNLSNLSVMYRVERQDPNITITVT